MSSRNAKIIDGKWLSKLIQADIKRQVSEAELRCGRPPGLGVILVGENPASHTYVASKEKIARACGFLTFDARLGSNATFEEVAAAIEQYNNDKNVDGILLQLPLPAHLDSHQLLDKIDPKKDADGLHPLNQGLLMRGEGIIRPCTPLGIMRLIDFAFSEYSAGAEELMADDIPHADLASKSAVVLGRSILVGKPIGLLLLERNATVTLAHSKTADLKEVCRNSEIIVSAVGVPRLVKADWVSSETVVIDVGTNRLATGELVGDVDYEAVVEHCRAISPVPGGVGPMTVTMLIYNTLKAYERTLNL